MTIAYFLQKIVATDNKNDDYSIFSQKDGIKRATTKDFNCFGNFRKHLGFCEDY